ncbi:aminotransferase class I/II-fold pyridoxal phosphate-dependent enzyme [Cerasicoccus arenae]|uniref:Pyridoxal phosphate-dependent aminotransferase n=1 Tax=Cerasicoccus arenae TaxID=424488 RepID=A0A8J3DKP5_9BACT|nr:aminotransferase class I/II-fold pyridoxal phosphate-dependent enzyme [Cerasicoccus arenae]MBK1858669.1 aminotransferase class I/II-fold pyridoxal phosphate-dependent enzyme [Cerasicoccus arenae]GHC04700.1 pyridoxal phosphate-dependent aminotransferase [Cerasicoccus arenae]
MSPSRIFLSSPDMTPTEREALLAAFDSGWIAPVGPHLKQFEEALCAVTGVEHAVALSSGTAALHLALLEAGVGLGDRVYCSTLTFIASVNAIRYCGAEPVFIDSEAQSWQIDPDILAEMLKRDAARGQLPKAVQVVDVYGQCANWDAIIPLCERYGVSVVEDASEALGATYQGRGAGSFGRAAALSFNGNKIVTTSGGGALLTNDPKIAEHARHLATQARAPVREYLHHEVGYNYRMSNLLAGLGLAQVSRLDSMINRRRAIFDRYFDELGNAPGVDFMPEATWGRCNRWLTCLTLGKAAACTSTEMIDALEAENIEARPVWQPMHRQPACAGYETLNRGVADRLFETGVCLPSGSSLSAEQQGRVIAVARERLS